MANFVPYLRLYDYLPSIQDGQLNEQVLDELQKGTFERTFAESWAIGKFRGRLSQIFDLDYEFTPTLPYDYTRSYTAGDRVTIDFPDWVSGAQNDQYSLVVYDGYGYLCLLANSDASFDSSKWQQLGKQNDIYYIPLPYPLFSQNIQQSRGVNTAGFYSVGDIVFWQGHTYSCLKETILYDQQALLQAYTYAAIPSPNVFPNDPKSGALYWKDLGAFEVIAGDYPTIPIGNGIPPPSWTLGDNRDPLYVQGLVDIAIWKLHSRISPMNIPKLRIDNMASTFIWLDNVKKGEETTEIQNIQPIQGERIRWGSSIRNINGYG